MGENKTYAEFCRHGTAGLRRSRKVPGANSKFERANENVSEVDQGREVGMKLLCKYHTGGLMSLFRDMVGSELINPAL